MARKRKSQALVNGGEGDGEMQVDPHSDQPKLEAPTEEMKENEEGEEEEDEMETCPLCPGGIPPQPQQYPELAKVGNSEAAARPTGANEQDSKGEEVDLSWIGCTRCKSWYHAVCLMLDGLLVPDMGTEIKPVVEENHTVEIVDSGVIETPEAGEPRRSVRQVKAGTPSGSNIKPSNGKHFTGRDTLPDEILAEAENRGYWWDWTYRVDRWYCPNCLEKAYTTSARSMPRSTVKRYWQSPEPSSDQQTQTDAKSTSNPNTKGGRPKRAAALNAPDYHALHNHISTPTSKWLNLIKDPRKSGRTISERKFPQVHGSIINKSWLDTGSPGAAAADVSDAQIPPPTLFYGPDREPIIIPKSMGGFSSLGGRLPGESFSVKDVAELVGRDVMVDVIDVATQSSAAWTLAKWADYASTAGAKVERPTTAKPNTTIPPGKVYNVISLEITGSKLAKQVKAPNIVSEIDWVDNFWPKEKKGMKDGQGGDEENISEVKPGATSATYPKVQLYCLMGMKGSWTDWHVDFAASSVYYTIHSGSKVFYFIKPTDENMAAYAKWSGSADHQENVWLGDWVDEVRKVTLHAGDTMIIPSGYIHAVYTPEDTLVFGGNFVHSYNIETQLRLREIEIETKIPQRFRFPYFDRLCWYVAEHYTRDLRQLKAFKPHSSKRTETAESLFSSRVLEGLLALSQFLVKQTRIFEDPAVEQKKRKAIYDRIPHDKVKDASSLARELRWRVQAAMGENSEDESPALAPPVKKRKTSGKPPISEIRFASPAPTKHFEPEPWTIESVPITHNVTPIMSPDATHSVGTREEQIHTQRRHRRREDEGEVVDETQEIVITTIVEKGPPSHNLVNGDGNVKEEIETVTMDDFHCAVIAYCIKLSEQCPIAQGAFSVGSAILLPHPSLPGSTTPPALYDALQPHFKAFSAQIMAGDDSNPKSTLDANSPTGLILSEGYSREIEGNTHAEANALTKFNKKIEELADQTMNKTLEEGIERDKILPHVWIYATMEPCSIRTSGLPSCSAAILAAGIKRVIMGVQEPPDFVNCQGIQLMRDGGIQVESVEKMGDACLKAARRGQQ